MSEAFWMGFFFRYVLYSLLYGTHVRLYSVHNRKVQLLPLQCEWGQRGNDGGRPACKSCDILCFPRLSQQCCNPRCEVHNVLRT